MQSLQLRSDGADFQTPSAAPRDRFGCTPPRNHLVPAKGQRRGQRGTDSGKRRQFRGGAAAAWAQQAAEFFSRPLRCRRENTKSIPFVIELYGKTDAAEMSQGSDSFTGCGNSRVWVEPKHFCRGRANRPSSTAPACTGLSRRPRWVSMSQGLRSCSWSCRRVSQSA